MINAVVDFVITIRKSAAGHAHSQIRLIPKKMIKSHFRVDVSGRHRQTQREIRVLEIGLVEVIKRVSSQGRVPFKRCVITKLDQFSLHGVHLRMSQKGADAAQEYDERLQTFCAAHTMWLN